MKVDVPGLIAAAQKLLGLATSAQGLLAETGPLAADATSAGAAARLQTASLQLWGAACAQAYSLHKAAAHLVMIAAKFGGQDEINAAGLTMLVVPSMAADDATLATLEPVPPIPPDVRVPLPPAPPITGEVFSTQISAGSAANGVGFSNTATNNGVAIDTAAMTVREVAAAVPELWESPVGTEALAGRLDEHVTALNAIADRWFELADQARKHADDYSQTVAATPKPQEFKDVEAALQRASAARDPVGMSQAQFAKGQLEARAAAEAGRYAGVTETTTSPKAAGAPQGPGAGAGAGAGGGGGGYAGAGTAGGGAVSGASGQAQLAKAGAAEAGQAGEGAGQLAQMLPSALGAIGGLAGGMAGMAGQVPQALMQTGQGLAQAATQGMSGLASKTPTDGEPAKVGDFKPEELSKAAGGGGGGEGGGATHPAGALGPPVTPSTSHTAPTLPSGAAPPPTTPTATGGSAMGGMPMGGMPMAGMMPHGQGGGDGPDKVAADKKVVTPAAPHTEPVTGRVADRTAAAAEASRSRADADPDDDPPTRGPVVRRITLAPLDSERT